MFNIFASKLRRSGHPLETQRIRIKGMTCKRCERTVKKALLTKNGVREVYINRQEGVATVSFDPVQTSLTALNDVILRKGYVPGGVVEEPSANQKTS